MEVEENIKSPQNELRMFADVFWLMGIPFVHTISENIGFRTSALMPNHESPSLKKALVSAFDFHINNEFNAKH